MTAPATPDGKFQCKTSNDLQACKQVCQTTLMATRCICPTPMFLSKHWSCFKDISSRTSSPVRFADAKPNSAIN
ncbi:hypothetical protein HanIR_Chr02g0091991 [Helianthus annuus]|nr:hypothetical protein HanIR_Chr02g0091991 [Helianthus annuus]